MERANIKRASVAVVLPDLGENRSTQDADTRTILTILAIEQNNPSIHTIAELLNEENVFHVRNAGCDEVIVSGSYTGTMLSQVVQFPGVSDVFGDLFSPGEGAQLFQRSLPESLVDKTFSEASRQLFEERGGVLMGYRRDGKLVLSPVEDITLRARDLLVLIKRH